MLPLTETETLLQRCWAHANERDFFNLSPLQLAPRLNISPSLSLNLFPSSLKLIEGMIDYSHRQSMKKISGLDSVSREEKLFEITMAHFDELAPYKKAVDHMAHYIMTHPSLSLDLKKIALRIASSILEAAGFSTDSLSDQPRVIGYCFLGASLIPTWLKDASPDQSAVLRLLDERLQWGQKVTSFLSFS